MLKHSFASIISIIAIQANSYGQLPPPEEETEIVDYANVVSADSLGSEWLFRNALKYVGSLGNREEKFELKLNDSIDGKLYGQSTFFVYSQSGILKKISGAITYQISIEVKDNKYRYHFNHFIFHYYKQDRNFNMVETGKIKPLEETRASGWQKLWSEHRRTCKMKMKENEERLTKIMKEKPVLVETRQAKKLDW